MYVYLFFKPRSSNHFFAFLPARVLIRRNKLACRHFPHSRHWLHRALLLCSYPATALWASNMAIIIHLLTHSALTQVCLFCCCQAQAQLWSPHSNSCLMLLDYCFKKIPLLLSRSKLISLIISSLLSKLQWSWHCISQYYYMLPSESRSRSLWVTVLEINECEF